MNAISLVLFVLGVMAAGVVSVGMYTYPCGVPLLLLSAALCVGLWRKSDRAASLGPTLAWILLTVGYLAWRMVQSPNPDFARNDAFLMAGAFLGFWYAAFSGDARRFSHILWGLWVLFLANMGVAIWEDQVGENVYQLLGEKPPHGFANGLYYHYNHFANLILGIGLLSFGYGMSGQMKWPMRLACLVIYGLAVYGIYLSHSRGAWLGLGCGTAVVFLGWLANLHRTKKSGAGVVLVLCAACTPLLVTGAWRMGQSAVAHRSTHDGGRLEFASMAVDLLLEKPLLGGGSRSYFFDSFKKWQPNELGYGWIDVQFVHNEYLQAAVDYGLIGAGLILVVMFAVFFRGIALLLMGDAKSPGDRGIVLGSMAALTAMGVQAFFSFVYHVLPDVILMGLCVGWLVRQPWALSEWKMRESRSAEAMRFQGGHGLLGLLMGVSVMVFAWRDAVAWWTMYPWMNHNEKDPFVQIERMQRALEIRPDFYYYGQCALLLSDTRVNEKLPAEKQKVMVDQAIDMLQRAVERAPDSYPDLVHLGMLYDVSGEYEKAEAIYRRIMPILKVREAHYGSQYLYARNIAYRAQKAWRQRKPQEALALFLQAKEELQSIKVRFRAADPSLNVMIDRSIKFLEGAGIKPAPVK